MMVKTRPSYTPAFGRQKVELARAAARQGDWRGSCSISHPGAPRGPAAAGAARSLREQIKRPALIDGGAGVGAPAPFPIRDQVRPMTRSLGWRRWRLGRVGLPV